MKRTGRGGGFYCINQWLLSKHLRYSHASMCDSLHLRSWPPLPSVTENMLKITNGPIGV